MLEEFNPQKFIDAQIERLRNAVGTKRALVAVSGGVDSTTCAVLTHKALGENLSCVILDDAFMREGEPEYVVDILSRPPFNVSTRIVDVRERFLEVMKNLVNAEEKRKRFRETFYLVLGETAKQEECQILVQGTIRADIDETVAGVKTQHNVLEQMGINPVDRFGFQIVEPLKDLYKEQVRIVARHLKLPVEICDRQPFPGPGLSVRAIGELRPDKLNTLRKATAIAEGDLVKHDPSQYFAVIIDNEESLMRSRVSHIQETAARFLNVPSRNVRVNIFKDKATGVRGGKRRYGGIVGIMVKTPDGRVHKTSIRNLVSLQARIVTENPEVARVFYAVKRSDEKTRYVIGIRAVQTKNFIIARVSEIPWKTLEKIGEKILLECPEVSTIYYDVTPKPPGTIEME